MSQLGVVMLGSAYLHLALEGLSLVFPGPAIVGVGQAAREPHAGRCVAVELFRHLGRMALAVTTAAALMAALASVPLAVRE